MGSATTPAAASPAKAKVLVKYMGTADVAIVEKSETFDGRYQGGLGRTLTFSRDNHFVLDLSDVPADAVDLLLEDTERFRDVTSLKRVPSNLNETIFGGHRLSEKPEDVLPPPSA